MSSELNRRRFIGAAGTGLALTSVPGIAAAQGPSSEKEKQIPFVVDDGKLEFVATTSGERSVTTQDVLQQPSTDRLSADSESQAIGPQGSPSEIVKRALKNDGKITGWDAATVLAHGAQKLNDLSEKGYVNFRDTGENVAVVATEKLSRQYNGLDTGGASTEGMSAQSCGVTKYEFDGVGPTDAWFNHDIYTNDEDTELLKARLTQGSIAVGALGTILGLSSFGVGTPILIACAILSAASGIIAVELGLKNDGCGVLTEIGHLPAQPGVPVPQLTYNFSITSQ